MNALSAIISEIKSHNQMSIVSVRLSDDASTIVSTVILETPETLSYLKINSRIKILFKETEVILSKKKTEDSSLSNVLNGTIKKLNLGELLTHIEIELKSGVISAIITKESFDKLNLKVGDPIFAAINSSEIMLME